MKGVKAAAPVILTVAPLHDMAADATFPNEPPAICTLQIDAGAAAAVLLDIAESTASTHMMSMLRHAVEFKDITVVTGYARNISRILGCSAPRPRGLAS